LWNEQESDETHQHFNRPSCALDKDEEIYNVSKVIGRWDLKQRQKYKQKMYM